jgi:glutaredoxin
MWNGNNMYIIYGKDNCPFCERAKALLTQKGLEFSYLVLGEHYDREELLQLAPDAKSVPQIWMIGEDPETTKYIGGYNDLEASFNHEVENLLKEGAVVSVTFTKVDGTERTMLCTQNPNIITETYTAPESNKERKPNPGVVAVYDIEKQGWRSFRLDSIKSYMVFEDVE